MEFAYNNSKQRPTGQTPFYVTHGFHPRTPIDLYNPEIAEEIPAASDFMQQMIDGHQAAAAALEEANLRQNEQFDRRRAAAALQEKRLGTPLQRTLLK